MLGGGLGGGDGSASENNSRQIRDGDFEEMRFYPLAPIWVGRKASSDSFVCLLLFAGAPPNFDNHLALSL